MANISKKFLKCYFLERNWKFWNSFSILIVVVFSCRFFCCFLLLFFGRPSKTSLKLDGIGNLRTNQVCDHILQIITFTLSFSPYVTVCKLALNMYYYLQATVQNCCMMISSCLQSQRVNWESIRIN